MSDHVRDCRAGSLEVVQYEPAAADFLSGLQAREVRLCCTTTQADPEQLNRLQVCLSDDEAERANRFKFDRHRHAFIVSRGLLRHLLARQLGTMPGRIEFARGPQGKPSLAGDHGLRFNVSHSGDMILYAFALNRELGVDLERHRLSDEFEAIARRFFAREEIADLLSLAPDQRMAAFFRCWTRKEAFIKAVGEGLSLPLDSFRVSLLPGAPPRILRSGTEPDGRWHLIDVTPCADYSAALVTAGEPSFVRAVFAPTPTEWMTGHQSRQC